MRHVRFIPVVLFTALLSFASARGSNVAGSWPEATAICAVVAAATGVLLEKNCCMGRRKPGRHVSTLHIHLARPHSSTSRRPGAGMGTGQHSYRLHDPGRVCLYRTRGQLAMVPRHH